ncbi:MAG: hypothetical protein RL538_199 [Candidatus Parcubacteria bacterium]|jgi:hypothetical protein
MHKASNALSVLQATAAIVGMAIILWSLGLPSLRFAEAANVTSFSDTLSDSTPSVVSNHTIEFVTPSGVASGETIVLTFDTENQAFNLTGIGQEDVDLLEDGIAESVGTNWLVTVNTTADTITLTSQGAGGVIAAGATTTILVGLHATNDGTPDTRIVNSTAGSYEISVSAGSQDSGSTRVAIVSSVQVTATVDTLFTFTVAGVNTGQTVNGTTTTGSTTAQLINFGQLDAGVASTAAQDLSVVTNAKNGFVVTVESDGMLDSTNGADIDGFADGTYTSNASPWTAPLGTPGSENTYGHWGITSNDPTVTESLTDEFDTAGNGQDYVSASTTATEVFRHTGPSNGTGAGQGTARVGYTVQISPLQEAATDYNAVLTYIATPVF